MDRRKFPPYIEGTNTPIEYSRGGWPIFAVGSEIAHISIDKVGTPSLMMIVRGVEPFKGYLATPGGHTEPTETTLLGALREFKEEVNIVLDANAVSLSHIGSTPGRDPNKPCVVAFYYHITDEIPIPTAGDDAAAVMFVKLDEVFNNLLPFDAEDNLTILYNNLAEKAYKDLGFFIKVFPNSTDEAIANCIKNIFNITQNPKYGTISLSKLSDKLKAHRSGFNIWE